MPTEELIEHGAEPGTRRLKPGTTGWSADDLQDPSIEAQWNGGRYEIVDGVLTIMPPHYLDGQFALQELLFIIREHLREKGIRGRFATEVGYIVDSDRIAAPDAVFMTLQEMEQQRHENAERGKPTVSYGRLLLPPTLIIESISRGYESHDRRTKRRWYAEAQVPNYWLLDAYERSLECLVLEGGAYRTDQIGRGDEEVRPSLFPGLVIPLKQLWP